MKPNVNADFTNSLFTSTTLEFELASAILEFNNSYHCHPLLHAARKARFDSRDTAKSRNSED